MSAVASPELGFPSKELQRKFGFEPERAVADAMELLGRN